MVVGGLGDDADDADADEEDEDEDEEGGGRSTGSGGGGGRSGRGGGRGGGGQGPRPIDQDLMAQLDPLRRHHLDILEEVGAIYTRRMDRKLLISFVYRIVIATLCMPCNWQLDCST